MTKRRWIETVGWIVSIILLSWFIYQSFVENSFSQQLSWSPASWGFLLYTSLIYVVSLVSTGLISWGLLKSLGDQQATIPRVLAASLLSQIGKYLPGNVAHHIGRVVLSRKLQLSTSRVLFCMLIETLWVLGVAAALVLFFVFHQENELIPDIPSQFGSPLMLIVISLAVIGPYAFHGMFNRLYAWFVAKRGQVYQPTVDLPSIFLAISSVLVYLFNFLLLGIVIALIGGLFFERWHFDLTLLGSAFAVAWIVGFFTPGSPAGLGVREVILLGLLSPAYGAESAAGITMLLRLVTVFGDGLAWGLGGIMWRFANRT